jgi:hypothetical protein
MSYLGEIIFFHQVYLLWWPNSSIGFDFAKTVRPRHVDNHGVSKYRFYPSIKGPTASIPALSNRITKWMMIASASDSKNIVAVGDNRLK